MPARATGTVLERRGRFYAQVTLGPKRRRALALPTCTTERQAEARAKTIAGLVASLRAAGHEALVQRTAEQAARADAERLAAIEALVAGVIRGDETPKGGAFRPSKRITIQELGEAWTKGELHRAHPDTVPAKATSYDDEKRLGKHVYPLVGAVPVAHFTIDHAEEVMRELPEELSQASRRAVAQLLCRLLKLATYPCRIIAHSPIPQGFRPKVTTRKALEYLYPDEDAKLLACTAIPLPFRLAYGILAREGMRSGELARLTFGDVDLERGAVNLDENKTDDPRSWALDEGVARALRAWGAKYRPKAAASTPLVDEPMIRKSRKHPGPRPLNTDRLAERLREHLRAAGVTRPALFERSAARRPLRAHDLRATFITLALANGRTETWVADRTGHRSSGQINLYRRVARKAAELDLGALRPLDEAIPELATSRDGGSATGSATGVAKRRERSSRRVKSAAKRRESRRLATASGAFRFRRRKAWEFESPLVHRTLRNKPNESDAADQNRATLVALREAPSCTSPRAALVADLAGRVAELAAAGDLEGARVASAAIAKLLGEEEASGAASVVDISTARDRKRPKV